MKTQVVTLEIETSANQRTLGTKQFWQSLVSDRKGQKSIRVKQVKIMAIDATKK